MNIYSLIEDLPAEARAVFPQDRRKRHRLLRRADILRAAEHIFARKGYHKATIQDIAKEAQYAVGTVYLYFTDKDALYFSILEEKMRGLFSVLRERVEAAGGALKKIEVFLYENLAFFQKNQDFFRIFVSEESEWSIKRKISKSSVMTKHREYFVELIKLAQAQHLLRKDVDSKQIANIFGSILTAVIFNWLEEHPEEKDLKGMSGIVLDMFLNGAGKRQ